MEFPRRAFLTLPAIAPLWSASKPNYRAVGPSMRQMIDAGEIPGAVTAVATRDGVPHLEAIGHADPEGKRDLKKDAIFWIASMTKPVTGVAVMMMVEEGKLAIEDPVGKFIPELGNLKTADGRPAVVTLRHMLTHTSGMGEASREDSGAAKVLADLIPAFAKKPVAYEPGTKWTYCQSGINTLARVVEIVSGVAFPEFLEKRIFRPLGMKDTTFYPVDEQVPRIVIPALKRDGKLVPTENRLLEGKSVTSRDRYPAANGGLYSTAADYSRFARMLLNHGALGGARILSAEGVRTMSTIHTGAIVTGFTPGNGWGLSVCVVREPQGITAMLSPGTYGHGGAYGTQAWIDPVKGAAYILMVQRSNFPNSDASDVRKAFQQAATGTA